MPTFLRQDNQVQSLFEVLSIRRTVEPLVETHCAQRRKKRLAFVDHADGDLVVSLFLHDLVMEDKAVVVFEKAHPQSQFDGHTGLAFADPFRMRLEDREDLLVMRNHLTFQHPAANLVDLAFRVDPVAVQRAEHRQVTERNPRRSEHFDPCLARALQINGGLGNVVLVGLSNFLFLGLTNRFVLGRRALELLYFAVRFLELAQVVAALAPPFQAQLLADLCAALDGLANRVMQQIDVGRKMNVRFDDKGVTTSFEDVLRAFFTRVWSARTTAALIRPSSSGVNSRRLSFRVWSSYVCRSYQSACPSICRSVLC